MKSILQISEVTNASQELHKERRSIVLVGGCFDLLHIGHITFLEEAKKYADVLMVLLESDESIKKTKGIDRPIHIQAQRAKMLAALCCVDIIVMLPITMNDKKYDMLIQEIHPNYIATTEGDKHIEHKKRQAALTGAKIVFANSYIQSVSTTKLLTALSKEL